MLLEINIDLATRLNFTILQWTIHSESAEYRLRFTFIENQLFTNLFQLSQAEECYQELLKQNTNLEQDIEIKANSLFIDSELCMESRRWFPVSEKLQPRCQLFNSFLSDKLDAIDQKQKTIKKKR